MSVASLGPDVVLAALFTFWQWCHRLFKIGGFPVTSVMGTLFCLTFLLDVLV